MLEVDISSDIDRVFSEVGDFFRDEIPFAAAGALNDTAFDIRRRIVGSTWPKAVTMRNRVFAGRVFRVGQKATKALLEAVIEADGNFDYVERLADGGTKVPRGNWIAVPIGDVRRNRGGSIPKAYRPSMLKNSFVRPLKNGKGMVILQRTKGGVGGVGREKASENIPRYILIKRAEIPATFRFEQDATDTGLRVFSGHFGSRLALAVSKSRIFSGA